MILLSTVYERKTPMSNDLMKEIVKYQFIIVKRSAAVYIKKPNRDVQIYMALSTSAIKRVAP